jgi:hypothetical protein
MTTRPRHLCMCSVGVQDTFFWRKNNNFLELERRDTLSAAPTYNCRNVPERSCANEDVICVITSAIDNYIPIEQLTFESATAQRPASLGLVALKIALFEISI